MAHPVIKNILPLATASGAGGIFDTLGHNQVTFQINGNVMVSGATVIIEGSNDGSVNWHNLIEPQVFSTASFSVMLNSSFAYVENVRASISSYADGSYAVYMAATGFAGVK